MSPPEDPFTELQALQLHELFKSYIDAGFRREEALEIIKALVSANAGGRQ